ncbi:MAG TPA: hypothetical protein VKB78_08305 [Pirellulales bacterium]|nr:hypothetical protein [Pirellulales bacterium]
MERRILGAGLAAAFFLAAFFLAATVLAGPPRGTTVQLPTFNFFTVATTVEVPDSGGGVLGGTGIAISGRVETGIPGLGFRPFDNVATGGVCGASGASIHAEIQDLDEMDRALLAGGGGNVADNTSPDSIAIQKLPVMLRPLARNAKGISSSREPSPLLGDAAGSQSVADMRRQQAAADAVAETQTQGEAQRLFDQAGDLQAAGKPGVAKVYYRMAARRATGDLKDRAIAALRELSQQPTTSSVQASSDNR